MKYLIFTSEQCVPCKNVKREYEEKYSDKLKIEFIDIFDNIELARRHSIKSAPTLLIIHTDEINPKVTGIIGAGSIIEFLSKL